METSVIFNFDSKLFKEREDHWVEGYKISDKEWVDNNIDLCVQLLEHIEDVMNK